MAPRRGRRGGGGAAATGPRLDLSGLSYEDAILYPTAGQQYVGGCMAYADNRHDLAETLNYFTEPESPICITNGLVTGFLLTDEKDVDHVAYIDAEVVVVKIPDQRLPDNDDAEGARLRRLRLRGNQTLAWHTEAFIETMRQQTPVALILDTRWRDSPLYPGTVPGRYCVMDQFTVEVVWGESSPEPNTPDPWMVRFTKMNLLNKAWWCPDSPAPPPLAQRTFSTTGTVDARTCTSCGHSADQVYAESWMCMNASCQHFWYGPGAVLAPAQLSFHAPFLQERGNPASRANNLQPAYGLIPNLLGEVLQGNPHIRNLWRGIVCPTCHRCLPRVYWHYWACPVCQISWGSTPGQLSLQAVIMRPFVNYFGHPPIEFYCPPDYQVQGPIGRPHYRVDKFMLHNNSGVILISPTAQMNAEGGADNLWNSFLDEANEGRLLLERKMVRTENPISGKRTNHFQQHWGSRYDFGVGPLDTMDNLPACVKGALEIMKKTSRDELAHLYEEPNQVSVVGYMDGMSMDWHRDGDEDVGPTVMTMSLGGDAELRIRLRKKYYDNRTADIVTGAYNWRNLQAQRAAQEACVPHMPPMMPLDVEAADAPEISLPLMHGTIVIFQGRDVNRYFEHEIHTRDRIRFSITARNIDEYTHSILRAQDFGARQSGQKFTADVPACNYDEDDYSDSDESAHSAGDDGADGGNDDTPPPPPMRPARGPGSRGGRIRPPPRGGGRRRGGGGGRGRGGGGGAVGGTTGPGRVVADGAVGRTRRQLTKWTPADDAQIRQIAAMPGSKWVNALPQFPGRTVVALRSRWVQIRDSVSTSTATPRSRQRGKVGRDC